MKSRLKVRPQLLLLTGILLALLVPVAVNQFGKNEVPIIICIGMEPLLDDVERTMWSDRRSLVYDNATKDPKFFDTIVSRIESCDFFKDRSLSKHSGMGADVFMLVDTPYEKHVPGREVGYRSKDSRFSCVVYEADRFVLVELAAAY